MNKKKKIYIIVTILIILGVFIFYATQKTCSDGSKANNGYCINRVTLYAKGSCPYGTIMINDRCVNGAYSQSVICPFGYRTTPLRPHLNENENCVNTNGTERTEPKPRFYYWFNE